MGLPADGVAVAGLPVVGFPADGISDDGISDDGETGCGLSKTVYSFLAKRKTAMLHHPFALTG